MLKRERIKLKVCLTRDLARQNIFDYIKMFHNAKRRHGWNNQLSPVEFEKRFNERLKVSKFLVAIQIVLMELTRTNFGGTKVGANLPLA